MGLSSLWMGTDAKGFDCPTSCLPILDSSTFGRKLCRRMIETSDELDWNVSKIECNLPSWEYFPPAIPLLPLQEWCTGLS